MCPCLEDGKELCYLVCEICGDKQPCRLDDLCILADFACKLQSLHHIYLLILLGKRRRKKKRGKGSEHHRIFAKSPVQENRQRKERCKVLRRFLPLPASLPLEVPANPIISFVFCSAAAAAGGGGGGGGEEEDIFTIIVNNCRWKGAGWPRSSSRRRTRTGSGRRGRTRRRFTSPASSPPTTSPNNPSPPSWAPSGNRLELGRKGILIHGQAIE